MPGNAELALLVSARGIEVGDRVVFILSPRNVRSRPFYFGGFRGDSYLYKYYKDGYCEQAQNCDYILDIIKVDDAE